MQTETGTEFILHAKKQLHCLLMASIPKGVREKGSIEVAQWLLCDQEHALALLVEEWNFITLEWLIHRLIQLGYTGDAWFVDGDQGVHIGIERP